MTAVKERGGKERAHSSPTPTERTADCTSQSSSTSFFSCALSPTSASTASTRLPTPLPNSISNTHEKKLIELQQTAFWSQWQLALHGVSTSIAFDRHHRLHRGQGYAASERCEGAWRERQNSKKDARVRVVRGRQGRKDEGDGGVQVVADELDGFSDGDDSGGDSDDGGGGFPRRRPCRCREEALQREVAHLQTELGKVCSSKAKLEGRLSDDAHTRTKLQAELAGLKAQLAALTELLAEEKRGASEAQVKVESALADVTDERDRCRGDVDELRAKLERQRADTAAAEHMSAVAAQVHVQLQERLADVESQLNAKTIELVAAQETWQATQSALVEELKLLKQKYSAVKLRLTAAAKKVESVRGERDGLFKANVQLKSQLNDVDNFLTSDKGRLYSRLEDNLATTRLALVEVEADRDELLVRLNRDANII